MSSHITVITPHDDLQLLGAMLAARRAQGLASEELVRVAHRSCSAEVRDLDSRQFLGMLTTGMLPHEEAARKRLLRTLGTLSQLCFHQEPKALIASYLDEALAFEKADYLARGLVPPQHTKQGAPTYLKVIQEDDGIDEKLEQNDPHATIGYSVSRAKALMAIFCKHDIRVTDLNSYAAIRRYIKGENRRGPHLIPLDAAHLDQLMTWLQERGHSIQHRMDVFDYGASLLSNFAARDSRSLEEQYDHYSRVPRRSDVHPDGRVRTPVAAQESAPPKIYYQRTFAITMALGGVLEANGISPTKLRGWELAGLTAIVSGSGGKTFPAEWLERMREHIDALRVRQGEAPYMDVEAMLQAGLDARGGKKKVELIEAPRPYARQNVNQNIR